LIHILEFFIDDRNKDVQKYEKGEQLEKHPVEVGYRPFLGVCTVMHNQVPALTRGRANQHAHTVIEGAEVDVFVRDRAVMAHFNITEQLHSGDRERKNDEHEEKCDISDVVHGEV